MNPVKITPSRIEDFEACPLRFDLLHVRHASPGSRRPSPQLSLGISVHECLYRFHEGGGHKVFGPEVMTRLLERSWIGEGYADDAEQSSYREEAIRVCEQYYAMFRDEPTQNIGNELFLQGRFRVDGVEVLLSGKLDRLSLWPDGRLEVIDYKMGNSAPPSPTKLAASLGTLLYYALARVNYAQYDRVEVAFLYLRTMTKVVATYDEDLLAECKARLKWIVNQISSGLFPAKPNGYCGWCEVRSSCPAMRKEWTDIDSVA